ncbi:protein MRP-126-like [Empidonax traillii]|uniref:protein MRP-126-like n=1 Tax=Empidonax traillii TaxID=164674 RepID=UPI000FFDAF7B|nr:protein MRP-126-like [Empidonax traillii]
MSGSTRSHAEGRQFPGNCTLEMALQRVVDVFHRYSIRQGELDLLSLGDFQTLRGLSDPPPPLSPLSLQHVKNKATIDELFKDLDVNKDAQISFGETMLLIVRVTIATHEHLHEVEDHQHQHQHHQHHHHH